MRSGQRHAKTDPTSVLLLVLLALAIIAGGLALDAARATVTGSGSRGTPRGGHPVAVVRAGALAPAVSGASR